MEDTHRRRPRRMLQLAIAVAVAAAAAALGCAKGIGDANAPIVVAVVEVTDAAAPSSSAAAPQAAAQRREDESACVFEAEAQDIVPSARSCTIYEEVSRGGRLFVPCGGADGPARGTFGEHDYRGEVRGKRVSLRHSYDFEEQDGCRWRVSGKISGDASSGRLSWSYSEEILEEDNARANCWATCTARTEILLSPVR